jgi:hypothetical protein
MKAKLLAHFFAGFEGKTLRPYTVWDDTPIRQLGSWFDGFALACNWARRNRSKPLLLLGP